MYLLNNLHGNTLKKQLIMHFHTLLVDICLNMNILSITKMFSENISQNGTKSIKSGNVTIVNTNMTNTDFIKSNFQVHNWQIVTMGDEDSNTENQPECIKSYQYICQTKSYLWYTVVHLEILLAGISVKKHQWKKKWFLSYWSKTIFCTFWWTTQEPLGLLKFDAIEFLRQFAWR